MIIKGAKVNINDEQQKWEIENVQQGLLFKNLKTGFYLASDNDGKVWHLVDANNDNRFQIWNFNGPRIVNIGTGFVLAMNGNDVHTCIASIDNNDPS